MEKKFINTSEMSHFLLYCDGNHEYQFFPLDPNSSLRARHLQFNQRIVKEVYLIHLLGSRYSALPKLSHLICMESI